MTDAKEFVAKTGRFSKGMDRECLSGYLFFAIKNITNFFIPNTDALEEELRVIPYKKVLSLRVTNLT